VTTVPPITEIGDNDTLDNAAAVVVGEVDEEHAAAVTHAVRMTHHFVQR
jgi:hypothetical protein